MITVYIDPTIRPKNEDNPFLRRFKVNVSTNQHSSSKKIILLVASVVNRRLYDFFLNEFKEIGVTTKVGEFNSKPIPLILSYKNGIEKELEKINFDEIYIIDDLGELPIKLFSAKGQLESKKSFYSTTDQALNTSILNNFTSVSNTFFIHSDILIDTIATLRLSHLFSETDEKKDFLRTLALFGTKEQDFISEHNYIASTPGIKYLKCMSVHENYDTMELRIRDIKLLNEDSGYRNPNKKESRLEAIAKRLSSDSEPQINHSILDQAFHSQMEFIDKKMTPIIENICQLQNLIRDLEYKIEVISEKGFYRTTTEIENSELEIFDQLSSFREDK